METPQWGMFENLKLNNLLFQKKILTIPKLSATRNFTLWNSFGGEGVVLGPHLLLHHLLWLKLENKEDVIEITVGNRGHTLQDNADKYNDYYCARKITAGLE